MYNSLTRLWLLAFILVMIAFGLVCVALSAFGYAQSPAVVIQPNGQMTYIYPGKSGMPTVIMPQTGGAPTYIWPGSPTPPAPATTVPSYVPAPFVPLPGVPQ